MRTRFALLAVVAVLALGGTLACSGDHSSPTEPKQTATLTVQLLSTCSGSLTSIDVALDGASLGTLMVGDKRDFTIPSGDHMIMITGQGDPSFTGIRVSVSGTPGARFAIDVGCSGAGVSVQLR